MKRIIGASLFLICIIILLTAMNQGLMNRIKTDRYFDHLNIKDNKPVSLSQKIYRKIFINSDRWEDGDLYGLCYLPKFKLKLEPFKLYYPDTTKQKTNRVLYIIGDSYLADKVMGGAFPAFDEVHFLDDRFGIEPIKLDTTKKNYLIMEFAERNLNGYTFHPQANQNVQPIGVDDSSTNSNTFISKIITRCSGLFDRAGKIIFNPDLNRNLELLVFDNRFCSPAKNVKADINYYLFKRLPPEVAISTDKKRLLLNITVDTSSYESAFRFQSDSSINLIVNNLKKAKSYYLSIGFKDVFLTIVPNAVSIYDDKRMPYNHLLQRIEASNGLQSISVFNIYKNSPENLFYRSDAHWNPKGFNIWVKQTNQFLNAHIK